MKITENDIKYMINECVKKLMNEKFSSPRLAQLAKDNGGIQISRNGGNRVYANA